MRATSQPSVPLRCDTCTVCLPKLLRQLIQLIRCWGRKPTCLVHGQRLGHLGHKAKNTCPRTWKLGLFLPEIKRPPLRTYGTFRFPDQWQQKNQET